MLKMFMLMFLVALAVTLGAWYCVRLDSLTMDKRSIHEQVACQLAGQTADCQR